VQQFAKAVDLPGTLAPTLGGFEIACRSRLDESRERERGAESR